MHRTSLSETESLALIKANALLQAINRAQEYLITQTAPASLFEHLLSDFLNLTESEYGFIGQVLYDQNGAPFVKSQAMTNIAWNEETQALYEENRASGLEFKNLDTLFGAVITTREAVVSNDPENDPRSGGLPKGHPPLSAFLGVPVFFGEEMVAMLGVANAPNGYSVSTVEYLAPLIKTYGQILEVYRVNQAKEYSEKRLKEIEERFKQIAEHVQGVFWITSYDSTKLIYASPAYERTWGRSLDELYQDVNVWLTSIHPDDVDRVGEAIKNVTTEGILEYRIVRPDQSIRWIRDCIYPIRDQSGQFYRLTGIAQDITDQKNAEINLLKHQSELEERVRERTRHLSEVNSLLQSTYNCLGEAVMVVDPETRNILSCNPAAERIFGYSKSELVGLNAKVLHVNYAAYRTFGKKMFSTLKASGVFKSEFDMKRKNNEIFPVESTITEVKDETGKRIALVNVARDISERKHAESTIQNQMHHLDVIDRISQLSMKTDLDDMLKCVLEEMLPIFKCDRAWILSPCDPNAKYCQVPMERTRPEWPGAFEMKFDLPVDKGMEAFFKEVLETKGVLCFDPKTKKTLPETPVDFSIQSQMLTALHVKTEKPWILGIHHCAKPHIYTEEDTRIFLDIAMRVTDGLSTLLAIQDLKNNKARLAEAQHIAKLGTCRMNLEDRSQTWSDEIYRILELPPDSESASYETFLKWIHPDDRDYYIREHDKTIHDRSQSDIVYRLLLKDGSVKHLHEKCTPYLGKEEGTGWLVATIQDISEHVRIKEELQTFQFSMEHAPEGVFFMTRDAGFSYVNEQACLSLGYTRKELMALKLWDIAPLFSREKWDEIWSRSKENKVGSIQVETIHLRKDGTEIQVDVNAKHLWLGNHELHVAFVRDITDRKKSEEELRQLAEVVKNTAEGIIITNPQNKIIAINDAFTEITGFTEEDALGQNPSILKSNKHDRHFYQTMWASIKKAGLWQGEIWDRRKNGEIFPVWQTISVVRDKQGQVTHYVSVFSDISSIKRSQEKLDFLAHHDPLTDLPNRLLFNDRLEHALKRAEREGRHVAILFLDLDRFKNINDSLGHPVGDLLLQEAAKRILRLVRKEDTVARLGGDEFIILIDAIDGAQDVALLAEKVISAFGYPFAIKGHELHLTVSVGVSLYPQDGGDGDTLIRNADTAMYRAKEEGRNDYQFYTTAFTTAVFERLTLENALRHALENEEFVIYFQPQYALKTGQLIGAEALIRWRHPEMGLVIPARFIPLAEESGLIEPIGEWVLRKACVQMQHWIEGGIPLQRIAVNVSGVQVQRGSFVNTVRDVLSETRLDPRRLELEITETFIMQKTDWAIGVLDQLKMLGVRMAIDDFGTGYSSLSYLKRLPVDKLKIDGSFVRDIPEDPNDEAIVRAVVALGQTLQLQVNAEGIETEEQRVFLKALGCHEGQGFFFSKALSAEDFESFFRNKF